MGQAQPAIKTVADLCRAHRERRLAARVVAAAPELAAIALALALDGLDAAARAGRLPVLALGTPNHLLHRKRYAVGSCSDMRLLASQNVPNKETGGATKE